MEENENKWTCGEVIAATLFGVAAVVAAPVIGLAWLCREGLVKMGVEDNLDKDNSPYDL